MLTKVFLLICCASLVVSDSFIEEAPVIKAEEKRQGYSCVSGYDAIGLMKEGEMRSNPKDERCGKAVCQFGNIHYYGCDGIDAGPRCLLADKSYSDPYPACCGKVLCFK